MLRNVLIFCVSAVLFSSCQKCYECTQTGYRYCLDYSVTVNGITDSDTECYTTASSRDQAASAYEFIGATVTTSEGNQTIGSAQELCGKASETDDFVELWESAGYNCTKQ